MYQNSVWEKQSSDSWKEMKDQYKKEVEVIKKHNSKQSS